MVNRFGFVAVAFVFLANASLSLAADGERGKALYDTQCIGCHESGVHIREHRKARTVEDVRALVARWVRELGLGWTADDVDQVVRYLDRTFYHYGANDDA